MVLLDSNIFILDRFFPRDSLYPQNKAFIEKFASIDASISPSLSWRFVALRRFDFRLMNYRPGYSALAPSTPSLSLMSTG